MRMACEVERAVSRVLSSVEFQKRVSSAVMQAQRDILNDIGYLLNLRTGLASADFVLANMPLHALKLSQQGPAARCALGGAWGRAFRKRKAGCPQRVVDRDQVRCRNGEQCDIVIVTIATEDYDSGFQLAGSRAARSSRVVIVGRRERMSRR